MPEKEQKRMRSKEEGTIYVSSEGDSYEVPEINASKLRDFKDNVYGRGLSTKQKNLIFSDKYTIEVKDAESEPDEDLQKTMTQMCENKNVRLWPNMQRGFIDTFWYGIGLYNPVWGYEGNEYRLLKLRNLPAYTFGNAPIGSTAKTYSQILPGITLNEKDEMEFWQTDKNGTPQLLKNVFYIKDPTAQGLAGESVMLPLVPIIEMLKYSLDTQMQQVHRTGAKVLFIKITDPQTAAQRSDGVSDKDYAIGLLKRWSKDMAFLLRDNMDIIDSHIKDDSNNLDVIDALHKILIDYVTPSSFISRDGATIGGTEKQREEMLLRYIRGIHSGLEDQFEMLLNRYLEYNGFVDYTVSLHIPSPSIDRSEIHLKQVEVGIKGKALFPNEIRKRLEADALDDDDLKKLEDYYSRAGLPGADTKLNILQLGQAAQPLGGITPKKVETALEADLKAAADTLENRVLKALEGEEK